MSPVVGMSGASFFVFAIVGAAVISCGAWTLAVNFPKRIRKPRQTFRQELAEASWAYWIFNAVLIAIGAALLFPYLLHLWMNYSIRRDTGFDVRSSELIIKCNGYAFGALIVYRRDGEDDDTAAVICLESGKWTP